jgi:hypothetical protein
VAVWQCEAAKLTMPLGGGPKQSVTRHGGSGEVGVGMRNLVLPESVKDVFQRSG